MSGLIVLISLLFLVVGYAYGRGAGTIANVTAAIGTIIALMLPYTVVLFVIWTLFLLAWYALGIPLGPS